LEDTLKKRYIIKLIASFISGLVNIILIAIVPKALGPVAFGQFSYLQQFFSQIIAFLDAGTSTAFFTKLSAKHERKELIKFYFIFSFLLLIALFILINGIDLYEYSNYFLPDIPTEYIYLGLLFGFFTWLIQIYIKISDAYALTVSVELIKIIHKFLSLILLLFCISYFVFDLTLYFYFHYISLISFILIISILFIKKEIYTLKTLSLKLMYKELILEFYKFSSPLFVFNIVAIAVGLFDIWLLQKISGSIQTGYYGLAYSIAAICFLFTSAMTPIITREFSKSFEKKDINEIKKLFVKYIPMLYATAGYFGVFVSFQSENLLEIFTDEKFKDAYMVLLIMAFYPIHQTYGQLSGSLYFATNRTKLYRNIGLISSFVHLLISIFLIYIFELGAVGLALSMIFSQIISVNIFLYYNTKFLELDLLLFIKHQIISVVVFILLAYTSIILVQTILSSFLSLLSAGIIYTILVLIATIKFPYIFSTNNKEIDNIKFKIKQIIYKRNKI
jgi:O-antigen/teichoic acid export membrane protein